MVLWTKEKYNKKIPSNISADIPHYKNKPDQKEKDPRNEYICEYTFIVIILYNHNYL